jgi:AcrR family transcriptional regulator
MSGTDVPEAAREEVARAVREALAKHGYAGLTTSKVAAESDKSEAFFFYHYDTKRDLVVAFLDWATGWAESRLADAKSHPDPVYRLYAAVDCLLGDPADPHDRGVYVAVMELLSHAPHDEAFHERLSTYERGLIDDLAGVVRDGVEAGAFRPVDPEATAAYLVVTADGTAGAVMALGMADVGASVRDRTFDYIDRVVLADGVERPADVRA